MKTHSFTATIVVVSILLLSIPSCSHVKTPSTFLTSFSLSETIKRMNMQEINVASNDASGTASAGNPSSHRREFDVTIDIREPAADSFDDKHFLDRLEELIAQQVNAGGVKVFGSGTANDSFHLNYQSGKHNGGVEVIGIRTDKNHYRVWCVIRELAQPA